MRIILILLLFSLHFGVYANEILDEKIERFCMEHKEANESYFKETHWERCTKIWQAQYRFETRSCTIWSANINNCFWLKRTKFLEFENKTESIKFWVNRYYKYEKYKTISQIIKGWYYESPITWQTYYLQGYTLTTSHQNNYYNFVKNYFHNN